MTDTLSALRQFVETPISALDAPPGDGRAEAEALYARVVESVPAYRAFLGTRRAFAELPLVTKDNYLRQYSLSERCWDGRLSACDFLAVSSGSTSEPTVWPRALSHEVPVAMRFEQVLHDTCGALQRTTLGVVCFPLGTWVGGMYTTSACRWVALKGYPLTLATPGNNVAEIVRVVRELGGQFEQVVLFGYPPFLKDVVDNGRAQGIDWSRYSVKLVLAGEVVSEAWRTLMAERLGQRDILRGSSSLYGTADAGVLGCESPLSIAMRRFLADKPELTEKIFGNSRLPTLVQYDPRQRYFEVHDGTLVVTADGGVPLIRYHIADNGGIFGFDELLARCREAGFEASTPARPLPFVYVFGRSRFAVSIYGANVFPETITIGLEQPSVSDDVTGKFVIEVKTDADHNKQLTVAVELAPGKRSDPELNARVTLAISKELLARNSEYKNYVPPERRTPVITLYPTGDATYFPTGVKHRYSR
jgi:phenylacetate-CoA ligase